MATPHTIRRFAECSIVDIGALCVGRPAVGADGDRNVTEVGVPNEYRAREFVRRLWATDKKGKKHLATCLCDNGSEANLQSEPDKCVDTWPQPVNLEGVSGHALPGGSTGSLLNAHMVPQHLWEERKVEDGVLEDYFYRAAYKHDVYLGHPFLTKNKGAPVGRGRCFCFGIWGDGGSQLSFLALWAPKCKRFFE